MMNGTVSLKKVSVVDLFLLNPFCSWLKKFYAYVFNLLFIAAAKILHAVLRSEIHL